MGVNKKRVIKLLVSCIQHDFGFYNPIWKWNSLPDEIKNNYELIKDKLEEWSREGHVKISEEKGEVVLEIISIPTEE